MSLGEQITGAAIGDLAWGWSLLFPTAVVLVLSGLLGLRHGDRGDGTGSR